MTKTLTALAAAATITVATVATTTTADAQWRWRGGYSYGFYGGQRYNWPPFIIPIPEPYQGAYGRAPTLNDPPSSPGLNENPSPTPSPSPTPTPATQSENYPTAKKVPGKLGRVYSPYAPDAGEVDVEGYPPGAEVKDPYSAGPRSHRSPRLRSARGRTNPPPGQRAMPADRR